MGKDKNIQVKDTKKWLIKVFSSMGIWFVILMIIFSAIDVNENQDTFMLIFVISFAAVIAYWIYSYRTTNKYVNIKEYQEINKNFGDIVLEKQLLKQGFSEDEIEEILKDRPLSEYIANQQFKTNERVSSSLTDLKEEFTISNKLLTKAGLGIVIDSKRKEFAIIQPNKEIQYLYFKDVHSYEKQLLDYKGGGIAMSLGNLTGNAMLYRTGLNQQMSDAKDVYVYKIVLSLNDIDASSIDIHLLHKKMLNYSKDFFEIESVGQEITQFLDKIVTKSDTNNQKTNNLDEIKKLKELLDMEAISQEEFDEKKKELLK